jgi:replicative DNA helicase Mcm
MENTKTNEELIIESKTFFESYKKEIGESIRKGRKVVHINFEDLASSSPQLAEELIENPGEILQILEVALEETGLIKSPRIRFNNLPETQKVRIRSIRAHHLNQLIFFEGIIRQASDVRPQVVNAKFECPACGTVISVLQLEKKFREPTRCSCGRKGQFRLMSKTMVDAQRLVLEESPESLMGGEQPRRMTVFLKEDLVEPVMEEKTTPGAKIRVLGILNEVPLPLPTGSISTRFDLAVEANNIIPLESTYEELEISEEDERQIEELSEDPELFTKLRESIAPSIYGYEEIKEALVLQMFGGVRKISPDGTVSRGDIHLFLIGDPGVAKSISKNEKIRYISKKEVGYDTIENLFKKFKKYPKDLKILTIDMKNHEPKWENVDEIIKHLPEKDLIHVKTEHGKEIIATKDHSFITLSKSGDIYPIKGEELNKITYLPIPINYHKEEFKFFHTEKFNKKYSNNSKLLPDKIKLDKDFGFFIGIFLAEGYIKNKRTIEISNKNKDIQKKVEDFSKKININYNITDKNICLFSKNLADILMSYCYDKSELKSINKGVKGNYSRIKKIPEFLFFAPRKFIYGILSGLFSGDGRLIKDKKMLKGFELITVSKHLAEDTSDLLFSIGILNKLKQREYTYKNIRTDYYSISVPTPMIKEFTENIDILGRDIRYNKNEPIYSYNNLIPCGELVYSITKKLGYNSRVNGNRTFAAEMRTVKKRGKIGRIRLLKIINEFRKKSKLKFKELELLKKIANSNIIWSRINDIEILKKTNEKVYDLSIPSTNTFVANGLGVHNSVTLKFISNIAPRGRYIVGKAASLDYNEPLLIKSENKQKFVKIGEFVDEFYNNDETGFSACHNDIECLSLNLQTLGLEWKPIKSVFRHKIDDDLLNLRLETGRKITITKDHSVFCLENGEIKTKSSENLKNGDYIVIPMKTGSEDFDLDPDIASFLGFFIAEGHLYNHKSSYKIQFTLNKNEKEIIEKINKISEKLLKTPAKISVHGKNAVRLTIYGKEAYLKVCSWLGNLSHKRAKEKGVPEIILNSNKKSREEFFKSYMLGDYGVTKSEKLMSELLYLKLQDSIIASCTEREDNKSNQLEDGRIITGTGKRFDLIAPITKKKFQNTRLNFPIECIPESLKIFFKRKLKQGYNRINLERIDNKTNFTRILKVYERNNIKSRELREIFGEESLEYFRTHDEWFVKRKIKNEVVFSLTPVGIKIGKDIKNLEKLLKSDVTFVKIKELKEIKPSTKFVYDISTPENENFVAGFGGIVCHNTGAGITATVVKDEFLKGWALEAGAMVLGNKGIVCIDEIEKMDATDRSAMHEALEQQTVTISKANVQACYSEDTEILTEKGWKKYSEVKNLKIAQFDPEKETIKFLKHDGLYVYDYKGKMYNFKNKRNDIFVTPNHKMLISLDNDLYKIITAEKIDYPIFNVLTTKYNSNKFIINKLKIKKDKEIKITDYIGKVFCFSTKTGFFITRRNGKIAIQGNTLQAQTSVLAAGNPKYGRFEPTQSITQQIDLPPALINRFDLIFILRDLPNKTQDDAIATHVLNMHQRKDKKPDITLDLFKKYIAYSKQKITPRLTDEAVDSIKDYYVKLRNMQSAGDSNSIAISARQLQGLVRLAEAHAKSRLSLVVDKIDTDVSIRLTSYYLMQVGYDPETKKFDIDRFTSRVSSSQRSKLILLKETIKKLEDIHGKQIPIDILRKEMGNNISDTEFEASLHKLESSGDIFYPKQGVVQEVK